MRDVTLLTKKGLRYEDIHDIVLAAFSDYKIVVDRADLGSGRIWISKGQKKIDIEFSPSDTMSQFQYEFDDDQLHMFAFDPYLTAVSFRTGEAVKKLVKVLSDSGLEYWIHNEDGAIVLPKEFEPLPDV